MIRIVKHFEFAAAHYLPDHPGKCKHLHGHTYKLDIGVSGPIKANGMIIDFVLLKELVNKVIIEPLDHSCLNELGMITGFPATIPTAENMILWIVKKLSQRLSELGCELSLVKLWETSNSWVEWQL